MLLLEWLWRQVCHPIQTARTALTGRRLVSGGHHHPKRNKVLARWDRLPDVDLPAATRLFGKGPARP